MNQYAFTYLGTRYLSAPPLAEHSCAGCAFNEYGCSAPGDEPCRAMKRADGRDVIFIREPALDAHLQTDLALPLGINPPPPPTRQPAPPALLQTATQQDDPPLTLEQRVEALERAFARVITAGAANELRKHDAAHVAPGALAETLAKPARDEKTIPPIAEMSHEHQIALMEGYLIAASNDYFAPRDHLDYRPNRSIYEAAYKRGWQDRGDQQ